MKRSADAKNTAPVTQTSTQNGSGTSCGCQSTSPAVQSIGQSSSVGQAAFGASSATQVGASNGNDPVRIHSAGGGGSLTQSNEASSEASGTNTAPVTQTGTQTQSGSGCGCSTGPAVQALGQSSEIGQLAAGLSSATQIGASNTSDPVRIASYGSDGSVSQENEAASSADASNTAPVTQTGTQTQSGSGVQALGQDSSIRQAALAASAANQLPGESRCGCGGSFGNSADPVRIASDGNDGALTQHNGAASSAGATNVATPTQTGTQTQSSACGCHGLGVQALGQWSTVDQLAAALSAAKQIGASNSSAPVRIRSYGGTGPTRLADGTAMSGAAPDAGRILRTGTRLMF